MTKAPPTSGPPTRRQREESVVDIALDGVRSAVGAIRDALNRPTPSPEELLLRQRVKKRRQWRNHLAAYGLVNTFLLLVNGMTLALSNGADGFWWPFAAGGWGIGLGMHAVAYFGWLRDHGEALRRAEATIAGALPLAMPAPGHSPAALAPAAPSADPEWEALLQRLQAALTSAQAALTPLGDRGSAAQGELERARADIERLCAGEQRLRSALDALAPEGRSGLDREIAVLDSKLVRATDARLCRTYQTNRAMLAALTDKVQAIEEDRERIRAVLEGFALAARSIQLDAVRLVASDTTGGSLDGLAEPARRLTEEVEILREVEAELERL